MVELKVWEKTVGGEWEENILRKGKSSGKIHKIQQYESAIMHEFKFTAELVYNIFLVIYVTIYLHG